MCLLRIEFDIENLSICFITLGAYLMYGTGNELPDSLCSSLTEIDSSSRTNSFSL